MKDDISPEERLLRLIRNPKKQNFQGQAAEKESQLATSDLKQVLKPSIYTLTQKYLSLAYVQKIISVGFIIAGTYFIFSFISPWIGAKKDDLAYLTRERIMDTETGLEKKEAKPYEYYLEGVKDRQIFASSAQPQPKPGVTPSPEASQDLIKDMNLLGVISGENPEAVIEDKKAGKTYYVTKGDSIGEFQVEDIQGGKVILNYRNQRYELYL